MSSTTRVDFHCHCSFSSDGYDTPEQLAVRLAKARIQYAALTDHDTIEGIDAFRAALEWRGIACITGVELSAQWEGRPIHLLAYGFDPEHEGLRAILNGNRVRQGGAPQAVLDRLDRLRPPFRPRNGGPGSTNGTASPREADEVIRVVHAAGGRVFLAHPLTLEKQPDELEAALGRLKALGLDGLEVYYQGYSGKVQDDLNRLAERHVLLKTGGSDFHGHETPTPIRPGVDMPTADWKAFRDAIGGPGGSPGQSERPPSGGRGRVGHWRGFLWRIVLPSLLTLVLFIATYFAIVIPNLERLLLDRKKEMIRELTNSAWSILAEYHREARQGAMTVEQAQRRALDRIRSMRYGDEQKDYFWITDMHPRMLMHPYRTDLEGKDLTGFRDPNDVALFVKFVETVREHGEGYVEYVWQWKDNPQRLAAKESYVKGFEPWGWVIGTGLYIEDVRAEIERLTSRMINISVVIVVLLGLLLLFIAQQSLRIERRRHRAEQELAQSHEKYKALVEAAGEGTMMVLEGRCTFANATLLQRLGATHEAFVLLDIEDILPEAAEADRPLARRLEALDRGESVSPVETHLRCRDGSLVPVLLSATRVSFAGREGMILNAKDISLHKQTEKALGQTRRQYRQLTDNIDLGVFRLAQLEDPVFLETNPAARQIFGLPLEGPCEGLRLFDVFHDPEDRSNLLHLFQGTGEVKNRIVRLRKEDGSVPVVSISGMIIDGEEDRSRFFDGTVEDITDRIKTDSERDQLIAELQTSLLFLNEPLTHAVRPPLIVGMNEPIRQVSQVMQREGRDAALVAAPSGDVIGIVTEHDFVARVSAAGVPDESPVRDIMSAPIVAVDHSALVFEAILLMQEKGLSHVGVRDGSGAITGVIKITELMQFHRYSSMVLTQSIQHAETLEQIVEHRRRVPHMVQALIDGGARPRNITRLISTISDTIADKLVAFAIDDLGPPPCAFAFVVLGSEGREEQTLVTDQDNAIIYEPPATDADGQGVHDYFLQLGRRVCEGLARAGYAPCKADMMASNPRWCQPLPVWQRYFTEWITTDDPRDFLDINIFFDFRCLVGERSLTARLHHHIEQALTGKAAFFHHFAQTVLMYKPPLTLFGQIALKSRGDTSAGFNIKDAMTPIVNYARIYALQHRLTETNTTDRLQLLRERKVIPRTNYEEILAAYNHLMQLRFEHEVRALREGREPDNFLHPKDLPHLEEAMLKQAFSLISTVQKQISYDFTGVA